MSIYEAQRLSDGVLVIYNMEPNNWWTYCAACNALYKNDIMENLIFYYTNSGIIL